MLGRREIVAAVSAAVMAGLAVFVAGVDGSEVVEVRVAGQPAAVPEGSVVTASTTPATGGGLVVWAEKGDVWLYDDEAGQRRALTSDGTAKYQWEPRFRGPTHVTYLASGQEHGPDPTLVQVDLTSGTHQVLRKLSGWVRSYGWSPDGATLAAYQVRSDGEANELHIFAGAAPRIRRFEPTLGRGAFVNYDETRIEWSRDGRYLLLLDTGLDTQQDETLSVLGTDGRDAAAPRPGTWARWSADGRRVYCLCGATGDSAEWMWQAIEVSNGVGIPLPIPAAARPALSPDGRWLAFDDGEDTPGVHVLDLQTVDGRPRFLARGALAPVWLSSSRLAVTDTRPCPHPEDECLAGGHGSMFEPAGTASVIDVSTGIRRPTTPMSTDGADAQPAGSGE